MPKESKKSNKEDKKKSVEKIDVEIADMIKSTILRNSESELEEDVQDIEEENIADLRNLQFRQFMSSDDFDSGSPVLERVALEGPRPIFVGSSTSPREESDEREINYAVGGQGKEDPKYFSESTDYAITKNMGFENENRVGEDAFNRVRDPRLNSNSVEESPWRPDRFDSNSERKETKYKFKVPKG